MTDRKKPQKEKFDEAARDRQYQKFIDKARELETDESEENFDRILQKIVKSPPQKGRQNEVLGYFAFRLSERVTSISTGLIGRFPFRFSAITGWLPSIGNSISVWPSTLLRDRFGGVSAG